METRKLLMKPGFIVPVQIEDHVFGHAATTDQIRLGDTWVSLDNVPVNQSVDEYVQSENFNLVVGQHILLCTPGGQTITEGHVTAITLVGEQTDHELSPLARYAAPVHIVGQITGEKWWRITFERVNGKTLEARDAVSQTADSGANPSYWLEV